MVITEELSLLFDLRRLSKRRFLRAVDANGRDTPLLPPHDAVITASETACERTQDTERRDSRDKGGAARVQQLGKCSSGSQLPPGFTGAAVLLFTATSWVQA